MFTSTTLTSFEGKPLFRAMHMRRADSEPTSNSTRRHSCNSAGERLNGSDIRGMGMKFFEIAGWGLAVYLVIITIIGIRLLFDKGDRRESFDVWVKLCLGLGGIIGFAVIGLSFGE